ncbi:hypothetical protein [Vibrio breoganii]|uniref:hypothetical protein n=1 Tax=Vibrio breoganii TaxID=553239 RepID=UPI000C850A50|nr:hypothetical protein [Vibrio breoganii]PMG96080.1 hypothetical protein BCU79_08075 [Vibrio breoganii]PMJ44936.1 hypothetical protein BCU21_15175 [Vibrio breoganii]PMK49712.1 hypothetical protein BCT98_18005 [Vibrio breoganii]PMK55774.1 hypothetical protein BCT97_12950 [Vibrio breoganii]PMK66996.1 hypothetical protein BCT94_17775 [Vibrio breoganii]
MSKIVIISFITLLVSLLPHSALSITTLEKENLITIRNQVFGGSTLNASLTQTTLSGETPPVFPYHLHDRVLLTWQIKPSEIEQFASAIELPPYLSVSKVSSLTESKLHRRFAAWLNKQNGSSFSLFSQQDKHYYLMADIAQTSGAEQGLKVEWKTFVTVAGSTQIQVYRFASFKEIPGNDLLELNTLTPSEISLDKLKSRIRSSLISTNGYVLELDIPIGRSTQGKTFSQAYLDAAENTLGPKGAQTRYYYDGSSVSARLHKVKINKATVSSTFPWSEYAHNLVEVIIPKDDMSFMAQPVTVNVTVPSPALGPADCYNPMIPNSLSKQYACLVASAFGAPDMGIPPTPPQKVFESMFANTPPMYIPTFYFALQDLYQGLSTLGGISKPTLFFELKTAPKTIFINFEINPNKVKAFKKAFLPSHFKLAKMRFYPEQKKAVYAISLNLYESRGANLNGIRAEWSTYVINPLEDNPKPRFSVIEAQSNVGGLDPLYTLQRLRNGDVPLPFRIESIESIIQSPNPTLTYQFAEETGIQAYLINNEHNSELNIDIAYPTNSNQLFTKPLTSWMEANDYVYWGEVAEILKYDRQVMFADLMVFEVTDKDVIHDTTFAEYVKPKPLPIVIWLGGQSIALQPWGNLESIEPE